MTTDTQDRRWIDEMVVALRLREVDGRAIGDAVASVEAHLDESGERAQDAFGDPRDYARSLTFGEEQHEHMDLRDWGRAMGPSLLSLVGLNLATPTARAWRLGTSVPISWGALLALALLVVMVVLAARSLRALVQRPLSGALVIGGLVAALTALMLLADGTALTLPRTAAALLSVVLLVTGALWAQRAWGRLGEPVIDPRDGRDIYGADRAGAAGTWMARHAGWLILLVAAALSALDWCTAA